MTSEIREQFAQINQACIQAYPKLSEAPETGMEGSFSPEVEEEANMYFQKIYLGQLSIEEVVVLLQRFKNSTNQRYEAMTKQTNNKNEEQLMLMAFVVLSGSRRSLLA